MASYSDDFNRASLGTNWTAVNGGTWAINASTVLRQTQSTGTYRGLRWAGGAFDSNNFFARVTAQASANMGFGVLVRCPTTGTAQADIDGYAIVGFAGDQWYRIEFSDGSDAGYVGLGGTCSANTNYTIEVRAEGSTITVLLNGSQLAQWTDTTYTSGGAMLISYGATITFDNFEAGDLASNQTIAPGGIASLEAFGTSTVSTAAAGQSILPGGVAGGEAFGTAALAIAQTVAAVGVTFGEYALRFYGNAASQIDRVRIPLEDGISVQYPPNVGVGDFTAEFWLRCAYADNATAVTDVRYSNIVYDRDSWGEQRGHCIGVTRSGSNLVAIFGQAGSGGSWAGIRSTSHIGDGNWHHVAVTRNQSTGQVRIWVDGVQEAAGTYDTANWSFPAGHVVASGQDNEYLVLGTEKHDVGEGFNGSVAAVRISNSVRYTGSFAPAWRWSPDASAVGLYLLDDGRGTVATDSATVSGAPTDGELLVGGSPVGPVWAGLPFGNVGDHALGQGSVTVAPSGLSSGETFGSAAAAPGAVMVTPAGVASGFTSDNHLLSPGAVTVSTAGVVTAEAFGAVAVLPGVVVVTPAGASTSETFATPTVLPGVVTVTPSGVDTSETFGAQTIAADAVTVTPSGVATGETFGAAIIGQGAVVVAATGVDTAETFASPAVLPGFVVVLPSGVSASETFGAGSVLPGSVGVSPAGVASGEEFGSPAAVVGAVVVLAGSVGSGEAFGITGLLTAGVVAAFGMDSGEAFGMLTVLPGAVVVLAGGAASAEAFGGAVVLIGTVAVLPAGVESAEVFGNATAMPGGAAVLAGSVASSEVFGSTELAMGSAMVLPAAIGSNEGFGAAVLTPGTVAVLPAGLASREAFGASLVTGYGLPQFVAPGGVATGEAFGIAVLLLQLAAGRTVIIEGELRRVVVHQERRVVIVDGEVRVSAMER